MQENFDPLLTKFKFFVVKSHLKPGFLSKDAA